MICMSKKIYTMKSKVWLYPGMSGWHFVGIAKNHSQDIKKKYGAIAKGFGSIPVEVTLGKTKWFTSIFPDKRSGTYLLPLKASVRKKEDVLAEDAISFSIKIV